MGNNTKYILAGNRKQAIDYIDYLCDRYGFTPDRNDEITGHYKIIRGSDYLRGLENIRVVSVGTYSERADFVDILDVLRVIGASFEDARDWDGE